MLLVEWNLLIPCSDELRCRGAPKPKWNKLADPLSVQAKS